DVGVEPRGRRVDHRDPGQLPTAHDAPVQFRAQRGQLYAVVDALGQPRVVHHDRTDPATVGACDAEHIGEVQLALGVVGGQPGQRGGEHVRGERVHPRVDLGDPQLLGVGVLVFHDADHVTRVITHDPAVPGGVVHDGGQYRHGVVPLVMRGQQGRQRVGVQQRNVPVGHEYGA